MDNFKDRTIARRRQRIIEMFCDRKPPLFLFESSYYVGALQDWITKHKDKEMYTTSNSIINAAWDISESELDDEYVETA